MAGDTLEVMPMSPRQGPAKLGSAVVAWGRSRRGRTLIVAAVFMMVVMVGVVGSRSSTVGTLFFEHSQESARQETDLRCVRLSLKGRTRALADDREANGQQSITSSSRTLSSNYHLPSWRPHLPNLPSIISSPAKPSNTTLELESGELKNVPERLHKASPNFHLLMPAERDDPDFCKSTLSAMILNYPPATTIHLFEEFQSQIEQEKAKLTRILEYLKNKKLVKDEDLLLIVDGRVSWFQLPSDVIIRQYQNILADANRRLLDKYGTRKDGTQAFNQTIVFGAEKTCKGEDLACRYAPQSTLPQNIYGKATGEHTTLTPARYLDSGMIIGPAKDLRTLYDAAVKNLEGKHSQAGTAQSVFAAMFGEQQLARDTTQKEQKTVTSKWLDWFGGSIGSSRKEQDDPGMNVTLEQGQNYEFSIGLDYAHILFQPFLYAAEDELLALPHDNSTDLAKFHHDDTPTPHLTIPSALVQANLPFWSPDLSKNDPRPKNVKAASIEPLQIQEDLDKLKPRDTAWSQLNLIQNTYTGAIPAILYNNILPSLLPTRDARMPETRVLDAPIANLTWTSLWYSGYERALLRKALRQAQSPIGFHVAAVGGDQMWDQRGGRGGIWTQKDETWLPWGEIDGVCGKLDQLKLIFQDGKGVWLHEHNGNAEEDRRKEEAEFKKKKEEQAKKDEERKKKAEEIAQVTGQSDQTS